MVGKNTIMSHPPKLNTLVRKYKKILFLCLYSRVLQLGIIIPFEMLLLNDVAPVRVSFTAFSDLF